MSNTTPKRKKNKVLKIVRKNPIWITIALCIVIALVSDVIIALLSETIGMYVFNSKIGDEYEAVSYMAKMYDIGTDENGGDIYALLNEDGRSYFITDTHGNILYEHGSNTMGHTNGKFKLPFTSQGETELRVYLDDVTEGVFEPDEDGELSINAASMFKFATKMGEEINLQIGIKKTSLEVPLWIAVDVKGGKQIFYAKVCGKITPSDMIFVGLFAVIGFVLVSCIIILMLINMINTLVYQKRISKVFFTDPITRGHNWMWFSFRGEQLLKKRRNAATSYAVLDLVFVKFRNYCVCHSVIEGEEMLNKVDKVLSANLNKKELAAHYASANFALLLKFKDREELKARIQQIIDQLEKIGVDHKFTFHVGVYVVENITDAKGRAKRRKDIDIEREYNNACTARSTLEECDDSGIAFFDENLVEEQKWIDTVMEHRRGAIENEEYVIYYQPKYDPKHNKLKGVEALIRWNSPELGFKSPGTFIPVL